MNIKYLKAGSGDSILLQDGAHNVLIDGGNDFTYLHDEVTKIFNKGQKLDLVIVTHHDDDHIKGIILLIKAALNGEFGEQFIKEIIVNTPKKLKGTLSVPEEDTLSYRQARDLEDLLVGYTAKWSIATIDTADRSVGSMNFKFLSPVQEVLEIYGSAKGAYLTSDYRCDWDASMATLEKYLSDESQDNSDSNKTSIVILAEADGKRVLLAGDCIPKRLVEILDDLQKESPESPVHFDYVKLPHHGSYRSLCKTALEKMACTKFIISTNSKKHYLPNKRAILKVAKWVYRKDEDIEFLFNYSEPIQNLKIKASELRKYKIKLKQNNEIYGYST